MYDNLQFWKVLQDMETDGEVGEALQDCYDTINDMHEVVKGQT